MNNLLLFIFRYSAFLLFVLLEIVALVLIVRYNEDQRAIFLNSSAVFSGKLYKMADNAYKYGHLKVIADSLANENAQLKTELFNMERTFQHFSEGEKPLDSCILEPFRIISASVINNSINQRNNHFTIDRGSLDGIHSGMGVISPHGIAGIVDEVGDHYSTAISLLHSAARISAAIKRNNFFGSLVWREINPAYMILEAIPRQADIRVNDTIITSGYSFIYPRGIFIGTVSRFWTEGGSNYYTIEVRLQEDISRLDRVYVVDYKDEHPVVQ
ncbi:MAG TPA: rod shape-determining protein MreC [Saprospiraceae bacterium]|nr:rod shape-determining protein MreC [Saprospiraceae bacterium]